MLNKAITLKQGRSLAWVAVYLFIVIYFAGTSQLEILHSFIHEHELQVTHSVGQEMDPCHKLVYHNDVENGCHHDSHLVASDKCQMCDLAYHGDQSLLAHLEFSSALLPTAYFNKYKDNLDSYWCVLSSSRAPPALG